jgi:hypothetical protein
MVDSPKLVSHIVLGWVDVLSLIGFLLGRLRAREWSGALVSLIFRPLGWLLIFTMADLRLRCPHCRGVIQEVISQPSHNGKMLGPSH